MRKDSRPSWIPLVTAIGIPVLLLGLALLLSKTYMPQEPAPPEDMLTTTHGQIYVVVKLETPEGAPVTEKQVTFAQVPASRQGEPVPQDREMLVRETDSAGFVTVTMVKSGDIEISVEGMQNIELLKDVQDSERDSYELKIVVNE